MLTLHPRMVSSRADGGGEDHDDEGCVCYCIVASCVSLMLFVVLAAAVTVARACLITGAVVLLLALGGWLVPAAVNDDTAPPAAAARPAAHQHRCACGGVAVDAALAALPTCAYEPPATPSTKEDDGKPRGSGVLCAVCLEDVQAGEMVRQLPACRHLFHVDCVDAWLRAHRTCPLCRCHLSPKKADALPPV